jgi:flagellar biosynthesis/type III secretory pathway protein FliH
MQAALSVRLKSPLRGIRVAGRVVTRETIAAPPPVAPPPDLDRTSELLESILEAARELEERRRQSLDELQEVAIELAMAATSRIVRRAIDRNEIGCDEIVSELLTRMGTSGPMRIAMHPDDLRLLNNSTADVKSWLAEGIELYGDLSISRGNCRATSSARTITSDWKTHLQEMRADLHEELEHAQVERRGTEGSTQRVKRFPDRRETA